MNSFDQSVQQKLSIDIAADSLTIKQYKVISGHMLRTFLPKSKTKIPKIIRFTIFSVLTWLVFSIFSTSFYEYFNFSFSISAWRWKSSDDYEIVFDLLNTSAFVAIIWIFALGMILTRYLTCRYSQKYYHQYFKVNIQIERVLRFEQNGITIIGKSGISSFIPWSSVKGTSTIENIFIIAFSNGSWVWLPQENDENKNVRNSLIKFIEDKLTDMEEV